MRLDGIAHRHDLRAQLSDRLPIDIPHVRHIEGKLWEMRPSGNRIEGRALYVAAVGRRVIIVLAFVKKTRKTPDRLIELALERAERIGR